MKRFLITVLKFLTGLVVLGALLLSYSGFREMQERKVAAQERKVALEYETDHEWEWSHAGGSGSSDLQIRLHGTKDGSLVLRRVYLDAGHVVGSLLYLPDEEDSEPVAVKSATDPVMQVVEEMFAEINERRDRQEREERRKTRVLLNARWFVDCEPGTVIITSEKYTNGDAMELECHEASSGNTYLGFGLSQVYKGVGPQASIDFGGFILETQSHHWHYGQSERNLTLSKAKKLKIDKKTKGSR